VQYRDLPPDYYTVSADRVCYFAEGQCDSFTVPQWTQHSATVRKLKACRFFRTLRQAKLFQAWKLHCRRVARSLRQQSSGRALLLCDLILREGVLEQQAELLSIKVQTYRFGAINSFKALTLGRGVFAEQTRA
jgi:hypothetical protein